MKNIIDFIIHNSTLTWSKYDQIKSKIDNKIYKFIEHEFSRNISFSDHILVDKHMISFIDITYLKQCILMYKKSEKF